MATMSLLSASSAVAASPVYRIDHASDGDSVGLLNGQRVRLVQIDTPEIFFGDECYGWRRRGARRRCFPPVREYVSGHDS
jgi:endonuclease YncB( thermonuclease family)